MSPVKGAREEMLKLDPAIAENVLIFPTDAMLGRIKQFDATALNNPDYIEQWQAVTGA